MDEDMHSLKTKDPSCWVGYADESHEVEAIKGIGRERCRTGVPKEHWSRNVMELVEIQGGWHPQVP